MNLIFNKNGKGGDELYDKIGFIDAGVKFKNLERFIKTATRDVIRIIGLETYTIIQIYYKNDPQQVEQTYVEALQDAIAIQAYRKYAPSKDVGHTQDGRRMRIDEHEKMPFEWMVDRDNINMERMYYESLDNLLEVLEGLVSWKATDEYKSLTALFVNTTADFQTYFDINHSRLLLLKLQPGMKQCEQMHILPRMGVEKFDALKHNAEGKEQLLEYVKSACVYWSLYWAFSGRLTVTLFPDGVLQRYAGERLTTQARKPAMMNETAWAAQEFKKDAESFLIKIEQEVAIEEVTTEETQQNILQGFLFDCDDKIIST